MPDLNNPKFREARKRAVLGRLKDPDYVYHNTTDRHAEAVKNFKENEDKLDDRKRVA